MKLHIRFADQVVGIFVIVALIMIATMLVLIGLNQRWFTSNKYFTSEFSSASGISPGTVITLKGIEVGKVESIKLNPRNSIDMRFYVYEEFSPKMSKNSILELISSPIGLGGGLVMHAGFSTELAESGSFIPAYESAQAQSLIEKNLVNIPPRDDAITRTIGNINGVLEGIKRTVNHLNLAIEGKGGGELQGILGGIRQTADGLPSLMARINSIAGKTDGEIKGLFSDIDLLLANLNTITDDLTQTSEVLRDPKGLVPTLLGEGGSIQTLFSDQNQLFNQIDAILISLNKTAQEIQAISSGLNTEVPKIASLIVETRSAVKATQDVMEGLKNNPLLRDGISKKPIQETRLESLRSQEF